MVIFQYIIKRNSRIYSRHNAKLVIANSLETLMYPRFTSKFPRSDRLSSLTKQTRILLIGNFAFSNTNFRNYGYSWGFKLRSHFRYYFIFPYFHLGPSTSSFLFNSLQPFLSFLLPLRLCSFFFNYPILLRSPSLYLQCIPLERSCATHGRLSLGYNKNFSFQMLPDKISFVMEVTLLSYLG